MAKFELITGIRQTALRLFVYGPEGIGKSTFAAELPDPIFIDVEGGTNQLPVARMPRPTSWAMLMSEIQAVRDGDVPCSTLVIDTADAAEKLCISSVCANNGVTGIEKMPYGKGYVFVKEDWCRMLDLLSEVIERNINVVLLGHSRLDKFERPDESGAYDRFSPKLIDSKRASVAAVTKEWSDAVLFLDYKIYVEEDNGKAKARGGKRVIRTTHHPCWDAKNRFGLPDEMPLNDESTMRIGSLMSHNINAEPVQPQPQPQHQPQNSAATQELDKRIERMQAQLKDAGIANQPRQEDVPAHVRQLRDLMAINNISDAQLRKFVASKGWMLEECPIESYEPDFVKFLTGSWDRVNEAIMGIPF